jgi:antitoxin CptB
MAMDASSSVPAEASRSASASALTAETAASGRSMSTPILDDSRLRRLAWRMRRGLLENDLILQRFIERHGRLIDEETVAGLDLLLDLSDNQLLDLLLARQEPQDELDTAPVRRALGMLRQA